MPDAGAVILASSRLPFSDSTFTPPVGKQKVTIIAKAEYFTGKGTKGWPTTMLLVGPAPSRWTARARPGRRDVTDVAVCGWWIGAR